MISHPILERIGIAAVQGMALWALYRAAGSAVWLSTAPGLLVGLTTVSLVLPVAIYLVDDLPRPGVLRVLAVAGALLLFGLGWHHGARIIGADDAPYAGYAGSAAFVLAIGVLCFHALPFVQTRLQSDRWRPDYPALFYFAWRNGLLLASGALFSLVFWLLLGLWAALLGMIGVEVFSRVFTDARFAIPATTISFGVGIRLAGSVQKLQSALRAQTLALLKWLAPLAALILAVFTAALLLRAPILLAKETRVISAAALLWLIAVNVLLLNAAYQDGRAAAPYGRILGRALRIAVFLLLPVAALAAYSLVVRVHAYGLTTERVWAWLVAGLAVIYAAGYAWAAWRPEPWMAGMGRVNVIVAGVTIVALTLLLSPVLSPQRLAAASQYARILATHEPATAAAKSAEEDRFRTLRFATGEYGRRRLAMLASVSDHPRAAEIQRLAQRATESTSPYSPQAGAPVQPRSLAVAAFPAKAVVEPELLEAMAGTSNGELVRGCMDPAAPCPLLLQDLDLDGGAEAVLFAQYQRPVWSRVDEQWQHVGQLEGVAPYVDLAQVRAQLHSGGYRVVAPRWQVFELGGAQYLLRPLADSGTTAVLTP